MVDVDALCKEMPAASVAERAKIHEESTWRILAYHVNKALKHVDLSQLDTIGVDEIAVKKGHKYITLFYDIKTAKAYQFKLALQRLWRVKDLAAAWNYLNKWYFWAAHSKIEEIVKLAGTVHKHSYGILEAIRAGLDNSVAEGLNNKVKTVVKRSYGFKTVKYRNTMVYLVAGKLELSSGLPTQC